MFGIHAMKNRANNNNVFPRGILSLAILIALMILGGGLVRQSAAQEPAPRVKPDPSPRIKVEPAPRIKIDLSDLDNMDLS
ncbi:MAG: hypothetical protein QOF72_2336, partial [Blastocatellia bacterium]|nr:hypothetical protein [Blastocatellia bacterium]